MLERLQQAIDRVQGLSHATYKEKLANTFGVVVECDAPRTTSGTDLLQTIRLVDESCPDGVALCIFGRDVNSMPRAQLGDILEVRNVVVQFYQDRPQLFAKMSKPHCFGYLLYRTNGSAVQAAEAQPVQLWNTTSVSHYAAERLPQLQALRTQAVGHATAADMSVYLRRIKDLAPPEDEGQRPACVDMRVRVLAIDQRHADEEVIMYVWDATDAKPVCASLQMPPSEYKNTRLQAARPCRHVMPLQSEPPGLQVLQDLPPIGTALPVIIDPSAVPSTGLPQVGDWVKIKVVGVAAVQGQWQVVFSKTSRLTQSRPSEAFEKFYKTRLDSHDTCEWPTDLSKVAVHCSIPSLPRISVRQMLLKVAERQPGPFRLQLRLLGHLPQDLQQWCKMRPQAGGGEPVWEWAAHLWLEDATGEVRALLLGQEGTKLLDIPPQSLSNTAVLQELQSKLRYLATVDDEGGVWIDAALTPLYAQQDQQQQRQQPAADKPDQVASQQEQQQQQEQQEQETGEPDEQPGEQADQQQEERQLQLVPVQQRADANAQDQPGSQPQQQADPQQQVQQSQQQGLQPAGALHLPPVFVLHNAVFATGDMQILVQDEQHEQPEQAVQPDQQEQQHTPSPRGRQPGDPDMQQLQAGASDSVHREEQPTDVGMPDASPQLSGRKRRHSDGHCTVL